MYGRNELFKIARNFTGESSGIVNLVSVQKLILHHHVMLKHETERYQEGGIQN
jgi:hypothetical protein